MPKYIYRIIRIFRIFQEWIHANIFKTQRYSFLRKDTNKPNRVCDLQCEIECCLLQFFIARYDPVVSNFVKFHTTTKVYPNDERCESLYIRKIMARPFAYPARFLRRVVPTPPRVCVNVMRAWREWFSRSVCVYSFYYSSVCAKGTRVKRSKRERKRWEKKNRTKNQKKKRKIDFLPPFEYRRYIIIHDTYISQERSRRRLYIRVGS